MHGGPETIELWGVCRGRMGGDVNLGQVVSGRLVEPILASRKLVPFVGRAVRIEAWQESYAPVFSSDFRVYSKTDGFVSLGSMGDSVTTTREFAMLQLGVDTHLVVSPIEADVHTFQGAYRDDGDIHFVGTDGVDRWIPTPVLRWSEIMVKARVNGFFHDRVVDGEDGLRSFLEGVGATKAHSLMVVLREAAS